MLQESLGIAESRDVRIALQEPIHFGITTGSTVNISHFAQESLFAYWKKGLIKYKFVIHCFIDGHSRLVTGIKVSTNNRAATVLELFLEAIEVHGVPSRCRGDHGTENVEVARWMERFRGVGRGSYIFGRSAKL